MIEHCGLTVRDAKSGKSFYSAALKPLGYKMNMDMGDAAGFMEGGHTSFWLVTSDTVQPHHVAFLAKNRKAVDAFYEAALAAGGKDNGAPGVREHYSKDYYAAFVYDPDGNNVEAVTFTGGKKPAATKAGSKKAASKKSARTAGKTKAKAAAKKKPAAAKKSRGSARSRRR